MKSQCLLLTFFCCGLFSGALAQPAPATSTNPKPTFDRGLQTGPLDRCDITWTTPSRNAGGSMPCGGGDIGLNVWVENGDLLLYFARSGSFDENNALLKGGRVRLRLTPNPLVGTAFKQSLGLQSGTVYINGSAGGVHAGIQVWVDVHRPVIHIDVLGSKTIKAEATYETWRTEDREMIGKANNANSYKWTWKQAPGGKVITHHDNIRFRKDEIVFYHRNQPGNTVFDVAVHQQGLDPVKQSLTNPLKDLTFGGLMRGTGMVSAGTVDGRYLETAFTGWRLKSKQAKRSHRIELVLATAQTATKEDWEDSLQRAVDDAVSHDRTAQTATRAWWKAYWQRSFIYINPDSNDGSPQWQAGRNYQLFRYMLGCNAFGKYPTKFNGGLFTYDPSLTDTALPFTPDFRNWGGGTMTAQNQRLVYFPLLKSGDFDVLKPQLDLYQRLLPTAEQRSQFYWGHAGACFTEQLENFGLPNPAEYGWDMPADHDKGVEYNAWLEYEWDTVLEFCLMMLEKERYTGTNSNEYLPFIESCLTFFNEHYQYLARLRGRRWLDGAGHLILYPGSAGETYKMAYNSTSTIAGLHTVLTGLLEMDDSVHSGLSDSARRVFTTMLNRLPPLSFRSFDGHPTIAPAQAWERLNNKESMQLYPVFPWGLYGVSKPGLDTAINTWKYDTDVVKFRSSIGWKQDNIFAARLGLTADAARLTVEKLRDSKRRFPAFWGPGFDWTPDHNWGGSGAIGLQEMLLQTDGKKILLFPAWPREWNVHFKLYAPYSTIIEGVLRDGRVESLQVEPESRRKDIISAY